MMSDLSPEIGEFLAAVRRGGRGIERQRWWTSLGDAAQEPNSPGALFMRRGLEGELTMMELFIMRDVVLRMDEHVSGRWFSLRGCPWSSVVLLSCLCGF